MRTPVKQVVAKITHILKYEDPDYIYLRDLFKKIRREFNIEVKTQTKQVPYIPTDEEIKCYYEAVWQSREMKHIILIKILLYTRIKVSELVNIKLQDIDFDNCQIAIDTNNDTNPRIEVFSVKFREALMSYINNEKTSESIYLFESSRKKAFTPRGIRKILANYAQKAHMTKSLPPYKLRFFLFTWLRL